LFQFKRDDQEAMWYNLSNAENNIWFKLIRVNKNNCLLTLFLTSFFLVAVSKGQTDYSNMDNWAFHPNKPGTLSDGFNLNIVVIDENLSTTSIVQVTNNSMKVWMYSISQGRFSIPKIWKASKASIDGGKLLESKEMISVLYSKLKPQRTLQ